MPTTEDHVSAELSRDVQSGQWQHDTSDPMKIYEAQQPPLYYWLMAPLPVKSARGLRFVAILLASAVIPLCYLAGRRMFPRPVALALCALLTSMPGLMIDIARVGNESLAMVLAAWIVLLLLRDERWWLGLAMGLALVTKAYFLALIPLLVWRKKFAALGIAIAISGWWYVRTFLRTGTWSGEMLDRASTGLGWMAKLKTAMHMPWIRVIDSGAWTHLWAGGWSFFTVKSWMYHTLEFFGLIVLFGVLRAARKQKEVRMLLAAEILFAMGIAYQTVSIFMMKDTLMAPGWYFYALIAAEVLLIGAGLVNLAGRRVNWAIAFAALLFVALDFYSVHAVLARKYSAQLNSPLWILYLVATISLPFLAAFLDRVREPV